MRTLQALAAEAIAVQDACNLAGVLLGGAKALSELRQHSEIFSAQFPAAFHPVMILWASKILHLTGRDISADTREYAAYDACKSLVRDAAEAKQ